MILLISIILILIILVVIKRKSGPIPKIVHQIYIQGEDKLPDCVKDVMEDNKNQNPEYTFKFYDYDTIKTYILENTDEKIIHAFKRINPECYTCISDFFRYIVVYNEGGIYLDVKTKINKPLHEWIVDDKIHIGLWLWHDYTHLDGYYDDKNKPKSAKRQMLQNAFMFPPRHPLLKNVIDDMCSKLNGSHLNDILEVTGPNMYTKAIAPHLKYYDYILYEEGDNLYNNNITFDGTHGEYYEALKSQKLHWSERKDNVTIK